MSNDLTLEVAPWKLVSSSDPILTKATDEFDFANPPIDPIQLAKDLYKFMVDHRGLGLAAPQVGLPYRVFAMYSVPGIVCFNPRVVSYSEEKILLDEGCLSFPNLFIKVKRPRSIRARYTEPNGNVQTMNMDGMTARAFQHELDHLDGITYQKRANPIHLARGLNQKKHRK